MGIKRCPYCRALVEEGEVYCRHCGTQLLFPEDELIEEDIPGEKIGLEEETEEEVTGEAAEEGEIFEDTEGVEEITAEAEDQGIELEEQAREESDELNEEKEAGEQDEETKEEGMKPKQPGKGELEEETEETGIKEEEIKEEEEEVTEYLGGILDELEAEETGEKISPSEETASGLDSEVEEIRKPLNFPTEELERITRSVDEAKKEVEEFLLSLKERAEKKKLETTGEEEVMAPGEAGETGAEEQEAGKSEKVEESQLPPWAEAIRDRVETEPDTLTDLSSVVPRGISFEEKISDEEREPAAAREKSTPSWEELVSKGRERKPWQTDSGVGLPERPGQQPLPFEVARRKEEEMSWPDKEAEERAFDRPRITKKPASWEEEEAAEENLEAAEAEDQEEETGEQVVARPVSRSFMTWCKARLFDLIFIGLIWMVTFVLAARVAASSFFGLLTASTLQAVALFLIFYLSYLFLFRFFIGETLGDRLFSSSD